MNNFTIEQQKEYNKCKENPVYFINTYLKFDHFKDGLIDFKLQDHQIKLINKYHNNQFNILKSPRQIVGKSITGVCYILHHILFQNYRTVGIFSTFNLSIETFNLSIDLLNRLKFAYENLPEWIKSKVIISNKESLVLENGSKIIVGEPSLNFLTGRTFSLIFIDEILGCIRIDKTGNIIRDKVKQFFDFLPVSSPYTKVIVTASKNFQEKSYFDKIWEDSEKGRNKFVRTQIKWYEVLGKDEMWKEKMIKTIGINAWEREFEYLN